MTQRISFRSKKINPRKSAITFALAIQSDSSFNNSSIVYFSLFNDNRFSKGAVKNSCFKNTFLDRERFSQLGKNKRYGIN